ncbi:(2Fe-2S)-binding protein [Streptomyces sp. PTM05]|uniref:(2Fe-2S)-binding protein n=1 Tax=Streptantibioticus parmotrematis TaxID=2873249 RepID=A0ABS7QLN0_9ACTN|nr:(2Fe-2S)-binding protein [Streptantibioticus parmotrematis]MBY8884094.1 (2Fe-2S)-binding protein [Streptantibioticus parmotrematis]
MPPRTTEAPASPPDTYHRLVRLCEPLAVTLAEDDAVTSVPSVHSTRTAGRGSGVDEAAESLIPARVDALIDALIDGEGERIAAAHGAAARRDVAASRVLHHCLWSVCLLFSGPWYLAGQVPRIPRDALHVNSRTAAFTLRVDQVTFRPGDGDALRAAVAEHVGPVLDAFAPAVRRGARTLWGMVTDDLASGLWYLGRVLGDEGDGIRAATAVLPGATPPLPGAADFRTLRAPSGRRHPTRTRLSCCLYYATGAAAEACLTCPRTPDAERVLRLEEAAG